MGVVFGVGDWGLVVRGEVFGLGVVWPKALKLARRAWLRTARPAFGLRVQKTFSQITSLSPMHRGPFEVYSMLVLGSVCQ